MTKTNTADKGIKMWWTPRELAGLPGLPGTVQGVTRMAHREKWIDRDHEGQGGGREFHFDSLPDSTKTTLISSRTISKASQIKEEGRKVVVLMPGNHDMESIRKEFEKAFTDPEIGEEKIKELFASFFNETTNVLNETTKKLEQEKAEFIISTKQNKAETNKKYWRKHQKMVKKVFKSLENHDRDNCFLRSVINTVKQILESGPI